MRLFAFHLWKRYDLEAIVNRYNCLITAGQRTMKECLSCGKPIPRRREKGHREREYCSNICRQRAYRQRNRWKHNLDRIRKEAKERMWNALEQTSHRETWQDELEQSEKQREQSEKQLEKQHDWIEYLTNFNEQLQWEEIKLRNRLADKEAEIVRLTILLEGQAKKKRP